MLPAPSSHTRAALRIAVSHYVTGGVSAALGLVVITTAVQFFAGAFAASVASVGVLVCIPPDQPAPRRGKFWQLLPAALFGLPLFLGVRFLYAEPVALIFSMALPPTVNGTSQWTLGLYFVLGAGLYLVWATAANAVLNARYRAQRLADTLLSLVALMRTRARQFVTAADASARQDPLVGQLLRQHAALADQLQEARDLLLESPSTARRRRLAGMLLQALEIRDHLLSWTLDLDAFKAHPCHEPELERLRQALLERADDIESLADALLLGRVPSQPAIAGLHRTSWARTGASRGRRIAASSSSPSTRYRLR